MDTFDMLTIYFEYVLKELPYILDDVDDETEAFVFFYILLNHLSVVALKYTFH